MLCRVGALSSTIYVGKCVHTLFWVNLVVPAFFFSFFSIFFSDRVNGMVWEWGWGGVMHKSMQCVLYHGGLSPSTRGEGASEGVSETTV